MLDDDAATQVTGRLQAEQGVDGISYLSYDEALGKSHDRSSLNGALDMLEENPSLVVVIMVPKLGFQDTEALSILHKRVS